MAKHRASVKGKGADIFLASNDDDQAHPRPPQALARKKATFYLPPALLDQLDDAWLDLRRVNRNVTKSELVNVALEAALGDYVANQKKSRLYKELIGDTPS